ncbi:hypothetical protein OsJ_33982 [Oryza sativa Japonica Group]|uniref:Uncharacterized protein n=1 Tax=Oryza sativa subsp. japonica TaxID=39947 RepID=A3CBJ3_ORYSJ|nr:hypothetical protein OsJ_33982 [Oryza sativa Japonica Group]
MANEGSPMDEREDLQRAGNDVKDYALAKPHAAEDGKRLAKICLLTNAEGVMLRKAHPRELFAHDSCRNLQVAK